MSNSWLNFLCKIKKIVRFFLSVSLVKWLLITHRRYISNFYIKKNEKDYETIFLNPPDPSISTVESVNNTETMRLKES